MVGRHVLAVVIGVRVPVRQQIFWYNQNMTKQTCILITVIFVVAIAQIVGFMMSDTGYFFSPTIYIILGGIELFVLGLWLGISISKKRK